MKVAFVLTVVLMSSFAQARSLKPRARHQAPCETVLKPGDDPTAVDPVCARYILDVPHACSPESWEPGCSNICAKELRSGFQNEIQACLARHQGLRAPIGSF